MRNTIFEFRIGFSYFEITITSSNCIVSTFFYAAYETAKKGAAALPVQHHPQYFAGYPFKMVMYTLILPPSYTMHFGQDYMSCTNLWNSIIATLPCPPGAPLTTAANVPDMVCTFLYTMIQKKSLASAGVFFRVPATIHESTFCSGWEMPRFDCQDHGPLSSYG